MFWAMVICNAIIPQVMWSKKVRSNITALFIISLIINVGMWYERFNIVVTSLAKDYLPSSWATYSPTWVEISIFIGTLGIFTIGVLFFFRFVPMIAISEVKSVLKPTEIMEKH
jgi:Ni/Fe-hydrogenase subunit HybB-like protein